MTTPAEVERELMDGKTSFGCVMIDGSLKISSAILDCLDFENAFIRGDLSLRSLVIKSSLYLDSITVKGSLIFENVAIGRDLYMQGIKIEGLIVFRNIEVKGFLRSDADFFKGINRFFGEIGK